jgi:hypothetical protein
MPTKPGVIHLTVKNWPLQKIWDALLLAGVNPIRLSLGKIAPATPTKAHFLVSLSWIKLLTTPSIFSPQEVFDVLALIQNIWTIQGPAEMGENKLTLRIIRVVC